MGDHRRSGGGVGGQSSPTEYKRGVTHVENRLPKGRGGERSSKEYYRALWCYLVNFIMTHPKSTDPPPPSLPPGEKPRQVLNKRLSTSNGTNASNHKVNSKNQPV